MIINKTISERGSMVDASNMMIPDWRIESGSALEGAQSKKRYETIVTEIARTVFSIPNNFY